MCTEKLYLVLKMVKVMLYAEYDKKKCVENISFVPQKEIHLKNYISLHVYL